MRATAAALGLLLALPALAVTTAAAPATLYLHLADPANTDDVPMTLQAPPANVTYREGGGITAVTFTCLPAAAGSPASETHTIYAVPYAAVPDDVHFPQAIDTAARGVAYATALGTNATLHWYLETDTQATSPSGDPVPGPVPVTNVVVRAMLREGEPVGGDAAKYDQGQPIASGESAPAVLAGPATQGATVDTVGGHSVYGIDVPLAVSSPRVPSLGMNLRVDVLVQDPACDAVGGEFAPPLVINHSSPDHRPRLDLDVAEPLRIAPPRLDRDQFGSVHYTAEALSVWGGVAVANVSLAVSGPTPAHSTSLNLVRPGACGSPTCAVHAPDQPAYLLWTWRSTSDGAAPGQYVVNATVTDVAGNTLAAPTVSFGLAADTKAPLVTGGPTKASPAPLAAILALLLLGLATAQRKRR